MKKAFIYLVPFAMALYSVANAQDQNKTTTGQEIKKDAKKAGHAVKKGAVAVGNKTAEVAAKGAAKVQDRTYDGKVAPNGRTVYITEDSRYYWVDKKGKRQYVTEDQLKDKNK